MNRSRGLLLALGVLIAALLALGAWLAVSLVPAAGQARDLQAALTAARDSIGRLDTATAAADLERVGAAAAALQASTGGAAWSIAEGLPLVGESARAAAAFASAAVDLASAAEPLVASIDGHASTVGKVMAVLEAPDQVAAVRSAAAAAQGLLDDYSPDGLRFGLDQAMREAQEALPGAIAALDGLDRASGPLASMLGADEPTTWLVMSQNPAELRGTGGLFNAYLIVRIEDGNLTIVEAGSRKQLDGEFPRTEQIPYWTTVGVDTSTTWGPVLGEWASFNIPADFPTVARLASAGMAQRGTPVDGVVAIDPTVIAAILAGTGPVEHKGVTIDTESAYEFFTAGIYEDFPGFEDVAAKDLLGMGLTYATIDAAVKRPLDAAALLGALQEAIAGGHVRAWSSDEADQAWLKTTPVAGSFTQDLGQPIVAFANGTGGKLDPYVTREVAIDTSSCETDGRVDVSVTMTNEAPTGLPSYVDVTLDQDGQPDPDVPSGFTRTFVTAYMPGTTLEDMTSLNSATLNGEPVEPSFGSTEGRPTYSLSIPLNRGESATVEMEFTSVLCPAAA